MTNTRVTAVAVLAGTALALGACSNDTAGDNADGSGSAASTGNNHADDDYVSPLNEFLGDSMFSFDGGGMSVAATSGGADERDEAKQRQVEDLVAACMADQGFEYVPRDPSEWNSSEFDEAYALPPQEFAERYGYGVTTFDFTDQDEDGSPDPNTAIRDGLSPEAQEAYDQALWGDIAGAMSVVAGTDDADGEVVALDDHGCYGEASAEVYGEPESGGIVSFDEFNDLFTDLHALDQRIHADPRLDEPRQAWVDCMADAGLTDFERPGDAREAVFALMGELYGFGDVEAAEDSAVSLDMGANEIDPEKLAEARDFELEVATADFHCQEAHWKDAFRSVQHELESEFVDQHRAELEAYRDQLAEHGGAAG
jgi:hypothetical protein